MDILNFISRNAIYFDPMNAFDYVKDYLGSCLFIQRHMIIQYQIKLKWTTGKQLSQDLYDGVEFSYKIFRFTTQNKGSNFQKVKKTCVCKYNLMRCSKTKFCTQGRQVHVHGHHNKIACTITNT